MQKLKLSATSRSGKKAAALRAAGQIPGILYGHGLKPVAVAVDAPELEKTYHAAGSNQLVEVSIDGEKSHNILFQDIQYDHLSRTPIHFDLYAVRMDEKIRAEVPIHFEGEAPAAYNHDAIIFKNLEAIEIEALPGDLPENFTVNLEDLREIGDSVHVSDVVKGVPGTVEVLTDREEMVIKADPPRSEEELEALEEAVPAEGAEAELVGAEHGADATEDAEDAEQADEESKADADAKDESEQAKEESKE